MGKLHLDGSSRVINSEPIPFIGHDEVHTNKHTRKIIPFYVNRDSEQGRMKYGLGFHVIMAGLLKNERGIFMYPDKMFDPSIIENNFAKDAAPAGKSPYGVVYQSYDSETVESFDSILHDDGSPATNTSWGPLVPFDIPNALQDSFSYPTTLNTTPDPSKSYTYVCQWDAGNENRRVDYSETWKAANAGNYFDIGGDNISVSNKIKYLLGCTEFHGALSGCAHLAMACGKPVHIYLPDNDTSGLNSYYKTSLRILRKAGATIHYQNDWS